VTGVRSAGPGCPWCADAVRRPGHTRYPDPECHGQLTKTPERWNELATINAAVNRTIVPKVDRSITRPWRDDATEGDCNDYALTKRSRLIDRGWPAGALLIATVTIPNGKGHAVLVVVTDGGAFVLDNLLYGITPWKVLPYRWHSIVSPENPQYWRRIISWLRFTPEPLFCPHAPVPDQHTEHHHRPPSRPQSRHPHIPQRTAVAIKPLPW
jgi:predicted transglutaminase-like cysteine proteinase